MSISLRLRAEVTVSEALSLAALATATPAAEYSAYATQLNLAGTTTPPVEKHASLSKALTAGAATIDLTAIAGQFGNVNFTGLKLQAMLLKNSSSNGTITVSKGASNGYGLDSGGATFTIPVAPGATVVFFFDDEPPDVAGGAKNLDLAGTGTQSLQMTLVAG